MDNTTTTCCVVATAGVFFFTVANYLVRRRDEEEEETAPQQQVPNAVISYHHIMFPGDEIFFEEDETNHPVVQWIKHPSLISKNGCNYVCVKAIKCKNIPGSNFTYASSCVKFETKETRSILFYKMEWEDKIMMQMTDDNKTYPTVGDVPRAFVSSYEDICSVFESLFD